MDILTKALPRPKFMHHREEMAYYQDQGDSKNFVFLVACHEHQSHRLKFLYLDNQTYNVPISKILSEKDKEKGQWSNSDSESPKIKEIQMSRHDMSHCHFNPRTAHLQL